MKEMKVGQQGSCAFPYPHLISLSVVSQSWLPSPVVLIYHSNTRQRAIVGLAEVAREAQPDS